MDSLIGWQWWAMTSELVNFPRGSRFSRKRLGDGGGTIWPWYEVINACMTCTFLRLSYFFSNKLFSSCVIALFINQSVGQGKSTNYCHFPSGYFPCHIVIVLWSVWSPFRYEDSDAVAPESKNKNSKRPARVSLLRFEISSKTTPRWENQHYLSFQ